MAVAAALFALLSLLFVASASAATRVWDGGCGEDTKWSCAANWSEDTDPGKDDGVVFNGTSAGDSTVDAEFGGTIASLRIEAGYTGTLSLERSLTSLASLNQAAGSFTAADQAFSTGELTLLGGSFTASSATTSVSDSLKISGSSTFDANGGTVEFAGTANARLNCGGVAFNQVSFTHTAGTKTVGTDCSMPLGAEPVAGGGGSIRLNGTLSGSGTLTSTKTLTLGGTGSLSGFSGLAPYNLTVAGEYDFGEYAPFTVAHTFTVRSSGAFTAPSTVATFDKSFVVSSGGAFDANGGTLEFDGSTGYRLACGGHELNSVVFASTGRKKIGGDCTLPLGEDPSLGSGGTLLYGTLTGSGKLTQEGNFVIRSAEPGLDSFSDVTDTGKLILGPTAVLTAPKGTLTVNGDFAVETGASFDANEGTVDFEAAGSGTKTLACGGITFNFVTVTNSARIVIEEGCTLPLGAAPTVGAGGSVTLNGALSGSGTLTVEAGTLSLRSPGSLAGFSGFLATGALAVSGTYDFGEYTPFEVGSDFSIVPDASFTAPKGIARFGGDFISTGPVFVANGGTVELTGAKQYIRGSTTFYNLTKVAEAKDTLIFRPGNTQTIAGALTLEGAGEGEHLSLVSYVGGETWLLEPEGTVAVKWATVSDSFNGGAEIFAVESTDAGGNTGWSF